MSRALPVYSPTPRRLRRPNHPNLFLLGFSSKLAGQGRPITGQDGGIEGRGGGGGGLGGEGGQVGARARMGRRGGGGQAAKKGQ